ncbi:nucleotidyltransferase family protein [Arcobacter sp.]|uniref:nucleotidyltransferase family protein n=1 Tax=Arcobacter sp. TaxID=1872629 RepID=UPI003D14E27C
MKDIEDIIVYESSTILEVLEKIDKSSKQLAIVVDDNKKLLGTISDGDIRRALLRSISLTDNIKDVYFKESTFVTINNSREEILNICKRKKIHQIPVVDNSGNLIGLEILDELISKENRPNKVVLMVGGLGTRLRPLTENIPKPMLTVGNKPILHTIVEKFAEYGYINIIMCVNYKSHMIKEYFEDGSKFGVNIEYIYEEQRMGTAGALSLLTEKPDRPFFVMNGDLLTNINFEALENYHNSYHSIGTMCVREYDLQVPYGVVNIENSNILSIEEKPVHKFFVNAGIYMLSPEALDYIPKNTFYDMPTLFDKLIKEEKKIVSFPIREYWLDIGRIEEYKRANDEYDKVF